VRRAAEIKAGGAAVGSSGAPKNREED
jgi:hypothetical protein